MLIINQLCSHVGFQSDFEAKMNYVSPFTEQFLFSEWLVESKIYSQQQVSLQHSHVFSLQHSAFPQSQLQAEFSVL